MFLKLNSFLLIIGLLTLEEPVAADNDAVISCLPDRLVIDQGGSVSGRVYWNRDPKVTYDVTWTSDYGSFKSDNNGETVLWSLKDDVVPGKHTARASVSQAGKKLGNCEFDVVVKDRTLSFGNVRKYFLVSGDPPPSGFASYSYMLLGAPPPKNVKDDRTQVLDTYLSMLTEMADFHAGTRIDERNITLIPVKKSPPEISLESPEADRVAKWVVTYFDYERSQNILDNLTDHKTNRQKKLRYGIGPYIVSTRTVTADKNPICQFNLLQDLSQVDGENARKWAKAFVYQISQQRDWKNEGLEIFGSRIKGVLVHIIDVLEREDIDKQVVGFGSVDKVQCG